MPKYLTVILIKKKLFLDILKRLKNKYYMILLMNMQ